jgi:competence protein ComEC
MSFAATAALVALYEEIAARRDLDREPLRGAGRWTLRWLGRIVAADVATTFVAGLAVAPLGIYFFHKMQQYAVLANLLAMPVVSFWLMPLVLVTLVAMPLGLEAWPLYGMAHGIDALIVIARWVAALPGAVTAVSAIPQAALLLIVTGGLWLVLWRRAWRWLGLVAIGAGFVMAGLHERPDVLVGRGARLIAVRADTGLLAISPGRGGSYEIERWLEHDGDRRTPTRARGDAGVVCRDGVCRAVVRGWRLAHVVGTEGLADACDGADIVVSAVPLEQRCGPGVLVIDAEGTRTAGTHAVRLRAVSAPLVTTVAQSRGQRPWTRHLFP